MLTYDSFWQEMAGHYPISKGTIRVPIATAPIRIEGLDHPQLIADAGSLLQDILDEYGTKNQAEERA